MRAGSVRIGCSGWNYASWRGRFYPRGLPTNRWLSFYAARFNTVEINSAFYRLPERRIFSAWKAAMPAGFIASVKASRYLTHLKRLAEPQAPVDLFLGRAVLLGPRLGPLLYQVPRTLTYDRPRLLTFLDALSRAGRAARGRRDAARRPLRHVIEFRHPSWYRDEVYDALRGAGVAWCLHDMAGSAIDDPGDAPFVYVRFHGATGRYRGSYPARTIGRWAARFAAWSRGGRDVYAYFNNGLDGAAIENASATAVACAQAGGRLAPVRAA